MESWLASNLILSALIAPVASFLAIHSMHEISSWNQVLYKLAQPSLVTSSQLANDFAYEVKAKAANESASVSLP